MGPFSVIQPFILNGRQSGKWGQWGRWGHVLTKKTLELKVSFLTLVYFKILLLF